MDTNLRDHSRFEGLRADHPSRTVPAMQVVVQLDVFEHLPPHGHPALETFAMDRLDLQTIEETLGARVVTAIALGIHDVLQVVLDHL